MRFRDERDRLEAIAEYARNVVAIWDQPRRDTAVEEGLHAFELVKGIDVLREALGMAVSE
jgi:hypothetical protein